VQKEKTLKRTFFGNKGKIFYVILVIYMEKFGLFPLVHSFMSIKKTHVCDNFKHGDKRMVFPLSIILVLVYTGTFLVFIT